MSDSSSEDNKPSKRSETDKDAKTAKKPKARDKETKDAKDASKTKKPAPLPMKSDDPTSKNRAKAINQSLKEVLHPVPFALRVRTMY